MGLGGFYIDELPYPNEAGAIPTTNVTREDAAHLCEGKGKRLCTELEWERACKGPDSAAYEYGDTYRPSVCGTGVPAERAARRPSGERIACKSAFGVREMHGGVWEWTDSNWERGAPTKLAVLRGGNATAGEVVGRCANALGRAPTTKSGAMGLRCCAGPRNEAQVDLEVRGATGLEAVPIRADRPPWGPVEWRWRPVPNEEISIRGECADGPAVGIECVCRIFRPGEAVKDIARIETGKALCGMVQPASDPRDLRMLYMDARAQSRTVKYALGRVTVSAAR